MRLNPAVYNLFSRYLLSQFYPPHRGPPRIRYRGKVYGFLLYGNLRPTMYIYRSKMLSCSLLFASSTEVCEYILNSACAIASRNNIIYTTPPPSPAPSSPQFPSLITAYVLLHKLTFTTGFTFALAYPAATTIMRTYPIYDMYRLRKCH